MGGPRKISDEQLSEWLTQVGREFATNDNTAPSAVRPLDAQPSHPDEPSPRLPSLSAPAIVFRRLLGPRPPEVADPLPVGAPMPHTGPRKSGDVSADRGNSRA
jgi:hypothetical protein